MKLDHLGCEFKASDTNSGQAEGIFTGYASTWDKDLYDDVILKGAFADTLRDDFRADGAGIPIHWQHHDGIRDIIGETLSAVEDDHGLLITARLDMDTDEGQRAYRLIESGRIHQMSIGYIAQETAYVNNEDPERPWDGYREIRKLKLFEISLVQIAANQGAEMIEVKDGAPVVESKAGKAISKANEAKIRTAYQALGDLLESIEGTPSDEPGDEPSDSDGTKAFGTQRAEKFKQLSDFFSLTTK